MTILILKSMACFVVVILGTVVFAVFGNLAAKEIVEDHHKAMKKIKDSIWKGR